LTHTEEQAQLRSETRAAFHGAIDPEAQGIFILFSVLDAKMAGS
jgi:hypothetical protein